jgi:sugar phosphate isomerase/epimerase
VPGAGLVLDSCHWHASGSGSLVDFPLDRLVMVHLNDAPAKPPNEIEDGDRVLPGRGVIRLAQLVADLERGGFAGPYSLETFNPSYWTADPVEIARLGRAALVRLFQGEPAQGRDSG